MRTYLITIYICNMYNICMSGRNGAVSRKSKNMIYTTVGRASRTFNDVLGCFIVLINAHETTCRLSEFAAGASALLTTFFVHKH